MRLADKKRRLVPLQMADQIPESFRDCYAILERKRAGEGSWSDTRPILEVKNFPEPTLERGIYAASASHRYWTLKRPEGRAPVQGLVARPILEVKNFP